jgi:hypothetical protein
VSEGLISISARMLASLTVCFALLLILVFGSVSTSSSSPFSLALSSSLLLDSAYAVNMEDAPATTEATTDTPPEGNNGRDNDDGNEDEDTQVTTRTITVEEFGDNDDNKGDNNKKKQDSNEAPKAVELGKCTDPNHEHDPFTNECKPLTPLTKTLIPACPAGQECRLNKFGDVQADNTATALNFGDFGGSANALAVQDIEVTQEDDDSGITTPPPLPPSSTTLPTPIPTPINPIPLQDQSKASLCPHEPEKELFNADNTATALNFGDFGCSANALAVQDIEVNQK